MTNVVRSSSDNDGRGPSGGIWRDSKFMELVRNPDLGVIFWEDFQELPPITPTTVAPYGKFKGFSGTNMSFVSTVQQLGGILQIGALGPTGNAGSSGQTVADQAGGSLQSMPAFAISASYGKLWFETRIKVDTIADTKYDAFVGLAANAALSATVPITATDGVMADIDFIGFQRPGDARSTAGTGGAILRATYKNSGQTVQGNAADFNAIVADTWIKLGFVFTGGSTGVLDWYVNGVKTGTSLTVANIAAATFPNDVPLGIIIGMLHTAASTTSAFSIDWVRCAQIIGAE